MKGAKQSIINETNNIKNNPHLITSNQSTGSFSHANFNLSNDLIWSFILRPFLEKNGDRLWFTYPPDKRLNII
jgi:hypothetical protein